MGCLFFSVMIDMKGAVLCLTLCLLVLALSSIAMPRTSASKNNKTAKTVNPTSSTSTVFSEGFEGSFPGYWNYPYDSNPNNGYDYWGDTSIRSHGGSWSAWCAQIGTQTINQTIWTEDFEGLFPYWNIADQNSDNGLDYWGDTNYRSHGGSWSAWCATNGNQHATGEQNSAVHKYDDNMWALMTRPIDLSGYSSAVVSYWCWTDTEGTVESQRDSLKLLYLFDGTWWMGDTHDGYSNGWQYSEVSIPASATVVGFGFWSDSSNHDFEGVYIDDVVLIGFKEVPNVSVGRYDDNMEASMYRLVDLSGYSSATLSYWYWLDSEPGYDLLQVIYSNVSGWYYVDSHNGSSGGWQYSEVSIPTSANYIGFYFYSDYSFHNHEGAYIDDITLTATIQPTIESCDAAGTIKDSFDVADTLYAKGNGYSPFATYNVYIVNDMNWVDGMNIPNRIPGTVLSMTLDASGNIPPITFWFPPLALGKYDIIVDVNNNSKYDVGIDALDDNDIQVTAGFQVVPEFPSILIMPIFMIATVLATIVYKRKYAI
jgi:hypothetical protein